MDEAQRCRKQSARTDSTMPCNACIVTLCTFTLRRRCLSQLQSRICNAKRQLLLMEHTAHKPCLTYCMLEAKVCTDCRGVVTTTLVTLVTIRSGIGIQTPKHTHDRQ